MQQIIQRVIGVLFKPMDEWKVIGREEWPLQKLAVNYACILAAIPAVAGFIGLAVIGMSVPLVGTVRIGMISALVWMIVQYVTSLGMAFGVAFVMDALAPTFGAEKDLDASLKVVVFSFTASWVGGIFQIVPALSMLSLLCAIYALVLMYFGMKAIRNVPADKLVGYYVTTIVIAIVAGFIVNIVIGMIATPDVDLSSANMKSLLGG